MGLQNGECNRVYLLAFLGANVEEQNHLHYYKLKVINDRTKATITMKIYQIVNWLKVLAIQ